MYILFGFLPIIPQPQFLGYLWIVFSMAGELRRCAFAIVVCIGIQGTIVDLEAGSRRVSSQNISFKGRKNSSIRRCG